ncbi:MAG: hypothetical protein QXD89_01065 [Candidatus Aenigmatarchaeota archaeon]
MGIFDNPIKKIKNYFELVKEKLKKEKLKQLYLKAKLKASNLSSKIEKNLLLQIFVAMIVPFIVFFPNIVQNMALILGIVLIVLIVVIFLLKKSISFGLFSTISLTDTVIAIFFVIFLLLASSFLNCGQNSCFWIISNRFGTIPAYLIFFIVFFYFLVLALITNGVKFWIAVGISTLTLYILIPFLSPQNWYRFCKNISFLNTMEICKSREVKIDQLKTVKIPTTGGINVRIDTPSTLYGGSNYEYTFLISNQYEKPIYFEVTPSIISSYGENIEFLSDFQQKTSQLKPKEYYQDSFILDKNKIKIGEGSCPWKADLIARAKGYYKTDVFGRIIEINTTLIPCASDKNCSSEKEACGKLDMWECECIDWDKATCSKFPLKAKLKIKHSGVMIGNVSLYYSEKTVKPAYGFEFTQGPLTMIVELQPNPYIASIHQYREEVSLFLTLKSNSGEISIKNIKVTPLNLPIRTIDKEKQIEIVEEIGTETVECRSISEFIPNGKIMSGQELGGKLCSLKPPSVKTTIKEMQTQTIKEIGDVTYPFIKEYCSKKEINTKNIEMRSRLSSLYSTIDQTGLCEILSKKEGEEKAIVEKAISYTTILIEVEYEREGEYYSKDIIPYTRTEECMKLKEKETE